MQKVTYTNANGQSVTFEYAPPFVLSSIEGLGDLEAEVQSQKSPYQHGATLVDTLMETRAVPIQFSIEGRDYKQIAQLRRYISSVFNPRLGEGTLTYENSEGIWELTCVPESSPFFPSGEARGQNFQSGSVDLTAHHPYWQSLELQTEPLAAFVPTFQFPFQFPVSFGERGSQATLYNDGDVPCPVEIEFNGPALQPVVTNQTTGEFIRVKRELLEGDKLVIHTAFGRNRKVMIERNDGTTENAWGYIDIWESTLFMLDIGENLISYDAVSSGSQAVVNIKHRNQYISV